MYESLTFADYSKQRSRTDKYTPEGATDTSSLQLSPDSAAKASKAIDIALYALIEKVGLAGDAAKRLYRREDSATVLSRYVYAMCDVELGDLLWYMDLIASNVSLLCRYFDGSDHEIDLGLGTVYCDFLAARRSRTLQSQPTAQAHMSIREISDIARSLRHNEQSANSKAPASVIRDALAEMACAIGEVACITSRLSSAKQGEYNRAKGDDAGSGRAKSFDTGGFGHQLGRMLWSMDSVADIVNLDMAHVAESNIKRALRHHGDFADTKRANYDRHLDQRFRFPQTMTVELREVPRRRTGSRVRTEQVDGQEARVVTMTRVDGGCETPLGQPLDDNSAIDDGYRFHDVLHLAHATVLGWSPLVRRLLKAKRKGQGSEVDNRYGHDRYDQVEDGARAIFTEEYVALSVFRAVEVPDEGGDGGSFDLERLDTRLFEHIELLVRGLEVEDQPVVVWREAYRQAFEVIGHLKERSRQVSNRSSGRHHSDAGYSVGRIHCDLAERKMTYYTPAEK